MSLTLNLFQLFLICFFFLVVGTFLGGAMDWYFEARRYHRQQDRIWQKFHDEFKELEEQARKDQT